ncbi:hypothetical protein NA749_021550 [Streptomyces justiciae]|nr:hypothetical protein [Streptomyces justiciae]MCW8379429.1 hypothetical protein [Streptomyces justiciae]
MLTVPYTARAPSARPGRLCRHASDAARGGVDQDRAAGCEAGRQDAVRRGQYEGRAAAAAQVEGVGEREGEGRRDDGVLGVATAVGQVGSDPISDPHVRHAGVRGPLSPVPTAATIPSPTAATTPAASSPVTVSPAGSPKSPRRCWISPKLTPA